MIKVCVLSGHEFVEAKLMYVRFIEITSPSITQFEMAASWFKTEWSVLAVKGGAISYDMVKLSNNSGIIVVYWPDEKTAKNFLAANTDRVRDVMSENKTRMFCQERLLESLDRLRSLVVQISSSCSL